MSTQFANEAAWIPSESARLEVGPGPKPDPANNEVIIKVAFAAVNPVDYKMQDTPIFPVDYPFIFGTDVAGTIVQLGKDVTRFELGQRVVGHCDSLLTGKKTNSGYQLYTTCQEIVVAAIPDSLPLANAAVLPLSVSTAAAGLFCNLKIPLPTLDPKSTGTKILIWGGSSSVGSSTIQLAVAAGFEVLTTASESNFEYVKELGASQAFNYNDPNVVDEILKTMTKGDLVYDCIATKESQTLSAKIVELLGGGKLPITLPPMIEAPRDVELISVNGLDPALVYPDVGDAVWRKYLPAALAAGKFYAKPDPYVITGGLSSVQQGIDTLRRGVSAKKVVIEIAGEAAK